MIRIDILIKFSFTHMAIASRINSSIEMSFADVQARPPEGSWASLSVGSTYSNSNATLDRAGHYRCTATNPYGEASMTYFVSVRERGLSSSS